MEHSGGGGSTRPHQTDCAFPQDDHSGNCQNEHALERCKKCAVCRYVHRTADHEGHFFETFESCTECKKKEAVDHPAHYGGNVEHEHVKCMIAWGLVTNAFLYNCTKYIYRLGRKDIAHPLEDLKKARWYLDKAIEQLEIEQGKE